jgi:starch phosphorylase
MFPDHAAGIYSVTNGIHSGTWAAPSMAALFDAHLPDWREDPCALRNARARLPEEALLEAHRQAKEALFAEARKRLGAERAGELRTDSLTLGFARRATPYKRLSLMFTDPERLADISRRVAGGAGLQVLLAGKAHPRDEGGQALIRRVHEVARHPSLTEAGVRVLYLPAYNMDLGRLITSGVDVWLNTPRPTREASGTSGMKAALNGVPNLSVLDGWWIEGHQEGVTGWSIEDPGTLDATADQAAADQAVADSLYDKLESSVLPAFAEPSRWAALMAGAIADNGGWFHTHRMVKDYATAAWLR